MKNLILIIIIIIINTANAQPKPQYLSDNNIYGKTNGAPGFGPADNPIDDGIWFLITGGIIIAVVLKKYPKFKIVK